MIVELVGLSQQSAQDLCNFSQAIRFYYRRAETEAGIVGHNRIVRVAARDNQAGLRVYLQNMLRGLFAPHSTRDGQIHDYGIERWIR